MKNKTHILVFSLIGLIYISGFLFMGSFGVSQTPPCEFDPTETPTIIITSPIIDTVSGDIITLEWQYFDDNISIPTDCVVLSFTLIDPEGNEVIFEENMSIDDLPAIYDYEVPLTIVDGDMLDFEFIIEYLITGGESETYDEVFSFEWQEESAIPDNDTTSYAWIFWVALAGILAVLIYFLVRSQRSQSQRNIYPSLQYGVPPPLPMPSPSIPSSPILPMTTSTISQVPNITPKCQKEEMLFNDPTCIDEFTKVYGKDPYEFFGRPRKAEKI